MTTIGLTGLVKIELPSQDLLLSDGGFINYLGDTYRSDDSLFGTISSVEAISEGVGDIVPAVIIGMQPPSSSAVADISQPGNQTSRVSFYIVEYDVETLVPITGDLMFLGQLDQSVFSLGRKNRKLTLTIVSLAERLFEGNIGNNLSPAFHKSVWSGETGHDNATGLSIPIAWGTEKSSDNMVGVTSSNESGKKKNKKKG